MDNSIEDAITKSKNEFVEPRPAKIAKIDSIEVQKEIRILAKQCDFCHEAFENQENLTDHVVSSHCKITCKVCNREYSHSLALRKHFTYVHAARSFGCGKCEEAFSTKDLLSRHHKIVHSDTEKHEKSFVSHDRKSLLEVIYSCDFCYKMFNSLIDFSTHICIKEDFKDYEKPAPFEKFELLIKMLSSRNQENIITDTQKTKTSSGDYDQPRIMTYTCEICGWTCIVNESAKRDHMKKCKRKPFECDICEKSFEDCKKLAKHYKVHDCKCEICKKGFISLKAHLAKVSNRKGEKCDFCDKYFNKSEKSCGKLIHMKVCEKKPKNDKKLLACRS